MFLQMLMNVRLVLSPVTRMLSVLIHQAAIFVPVILGIVVMERHALMSMSVRGVHVMKMQCVITLMEASFVSVTVNLLVMGYPVHVSKCIWSTSVFMSLFIHV